MALPHRLPERLARTDRLVLRRWAPTDAELLARAVAESVEHLRPWMAWVAQEPLSLERRTVLLEEWEDDWLRGGDVLMGVFVDGAVAGGCGLHRRIGLSGLEIGYWTHPAFLRRGVATSAAARLREAAFTVPRITHVEIHHDKANQASRGVPEKLGFQLIDELPDDPEAPADVGVECRWRLTRREWDRR